MLFSMFLGVVAGVAATALGAGHYGVALSALLGNLPFTLGVYGSHLVAGSIRELVTPESSGHLLMGLVKPGKFSFSNKSEQQKLCFSLALLKAGLLMGGLLIGATLCAMGADRVPEPISYLICLGLFVVIMRKQNAGEIGLAAIAVMGMGALVWFLGSILQIPGAIVVILVALSPLGRSSERMTTQAHDAISSLQDKAWHATLWGFLTGLVPGLNAASVVESSDSEINDGLRTVAIDAIAEGISISIFLFARPTGKTMLTEVMKYVTYGELLSTYWLLGCLLLAIGLTLGFGWGICWGLLSRSRVDLSVAVGLLTSVIYCSNNTFVGLFPHSGLAAGAVISLGLFGITSAVGRMSRQGFIPEGVQPLLPSVPILLG